MKYILILLLCMILFSCTDYTTGRRFQDDYLVIGGMIYAGETITSDNLIVVSRSISLNGGNITDFIVSDAIVFIEDIETKEIQDLSFTADITSRKFGYYDSSNSFLIESGKTYKLTAIIDQDTVFALTTVPLPFELLENEGYTADVNGSFPIMIHQEIDELYPIEIKVDRQENTVIFLEYYCLEEWNNAIYTIFDYLGFSEQIPNTPEDYESTMSGYPRRNTDMDTFFPSNINEEYIIRIPFNQFNFLFYGRYKVTTMKIDENYFKYNYKSQGYFHGGVVGGIGYFGSGSKQTRYTYVVKM